MPKVSVLVPVYRTNPDHLREAIRSILGQTFADFELLLLDDCPQDDRAAVVAEFSDPRIRYERNEANMGISPTRNKLIDMAQGEYLAVMDHDDISLPTRFEKQVAYLDAHPEVGIVSCKIMLVGGRKALTIFPEDDMSIKLGLMDNAQMMHPASMMRQSTLREHNIRYEAEFSPCEDYALWCRLIPHTCFHNLQEVLFHYRNHPDNTTNSQAQRIMRGRHAVQAFARAAHPELYEAFLARQESITRTKLFGCIPLLKVVENRQRKRAWLFNVIPFYDKKVKAYLGSLR